MSLLLLDSIGRISSFSIRFSDNFKGLSKGHNRGRLSACGLSSRTWLFVCFDGNRIGRCYFCLGLSNLGRGRGLFRWRGRRCRGCGVDLDLRRQNASVFGPWLPVKG
jgi:hypothetical protein